MSAKRSYDDGCAVAHALDLIGERWALLVARELMLGPRRFKDLRAALPGISPNVLTQRLDDLERAAVVRQRRLPPPAAAWAYELTDWGHELEPVLQALGRWAARSPAMALDRPMSVTSLVLSLRTMFAADAAAGLRATFDLRLDDQPFAAKIKKRKLAIAPGTAPDADAVLAGAPAALAAVIYGSRALAAAEAVGEIEIGGDRAAVERFVTLFPLPAPAPAAAADLAAP